MHGKCLWDIITSQNRELCTCLCHPSMGIRHLLKTVIIFITTAFSAGWIQNESGEGGQFSFCSSRFMLQGQPGMVNLTVLILLLVLSQLKGRVRKSFYFRTCHREMRLSKWLPPRFLFQGKFQKKNTLICWSGKSSVNKGKKGYYSQDILYVQRAVHSANAQPLTN